MTILGLGGNQSYSGRIENNGRSNQVQFAIYR
jgi:hypothetical protein